MSLENEFKKLINNLKSDEEVEEKLEEEFEVQENDVIEDNYEIKEEIFKDQKGESQMELEEVEDKMEEFKGDKMEMGTNNFEAALVSSLEAMKKSTKAFEAMQSFSKELEKSIEDMEIAMKSFEDLIQAKENISKVKNSIERANETYKKMEDAIMEIK